MDRYTLNILAPEGGRRVAVTLPASATLASVLAEACTRLGIERTPDLGLVHGRAPLADLAATPLRLAGLPAGAHLEIVRTAAVRACPGAAVTVVCVDAATGARGTPVAVRRDASLGAALLAASVPLYKQKDVGTELASVQAAGAVHSGIDALAHASLGDLAASSSSVLLRVSYRPSDASFEALERLSADMRLVDTTPVSLQRPKQSLPSAVPAQPSKSPQGDQESHTAAGVRRDVTARRVFENLQGAPELPTSDYDVTPAHFAAAHADAVARTRRLADAPLVSKAAVEGKRRAELLARHPRTRIRFRVRQAAAPAGAPEWLVEASFAATETAAALHAFVRADVLCGAEASIVLRTAAPSKVLPADATQLVDLGLLPSAVLFAEVSAASDIDLSHMPAARGEAGAAPVRSPSTLPSPSLLSASSRLPEPKQASCCRPPWMRL